MTDFTEPHTMICGHKWIPGVSLCNKVVDTEEGLVYLVSGGTKLLKHAKFTVVTMQHGIVPLKYTVMFAAVLSI